MLTLVNVKGAHFSIKMTIIHNFLLLFIGRCMFPMHLYVYMGWIILVCICNNGLIILPHAAMFASQPIFKIPSMIRMATFLCYIFLWKSNFPVLQISWIISDGLTWTKQGDVATNGYYTIFNLRAHQNTAYYQHQRQLYKEQYKTHLCVKFARLSCESMESNILLLYMHTFNGASHDTVGEMLVQLHQAQLLHFLAMIAWWHHKILRWNS